MPSLPVRQLGSIGIVKDVEPYDLPNNAFSDGMNVRFDNNKVQRAPIFRTLFASLTGSVPVWCFGLFSTSGFDSVLYANDDGRLFSVANGSETNITESGHSNATDARPYTGTQLAQCVYVNRPDAVPRVLTPAASTFIALPNWDSTWRCASLRAFGSFLVALNVSKGGTSIPNLVKWSDTTTNGTYPDSWDDTDTTKLAGENPLTGMKTPIVDGGTLGPNFVIYSADEAWMMAQVGGTFEFNFYRLPFDNAGLINPNCFVEIDGLHYVWGPNDIFVHDGVATKKSIIEGRNREKFFQELNLKKAAVFFVSQDKLRHEISFCGVSGSANAAFPTPNGYCNYAAVYNYVHDTWTFKDLPNTSFASEANADTVLTYASADTAGLTYDIVGGSYYDQEDGFGRVPMYTVVADTPNGISVSKIDAMDAADHGSKLALALDTETLTPAWFERIGWGMDEGGSDLRTYYSIRSVSPHVTVFTPGVTVQGQVGASLLPNAPPTYDPVASFDPATMYKFDSRQGGRYLAYRITMNTANDFDATGFNLDAVPIGRR